MTIGELKEILEGEPDDAEIKIGINQGHGEENEEVFDIEDIGYSHIHQCSVLWQA